MCKIIIITDRERFNPNHNLMSSTIFTLGIDRSQITYGEGGAQRTQPILQRTWQLKAKILRTGVIQSVKIKISKKWCHKNQ